MKQILMTTPTKFGVHYSINPWMEGNEGNVDLLRAVQQWSELRNALISAGVDVIVLPEPDKSCPDAVFTANAGLIYGDLFITSRFKHEERQAEENYFQSYFCDHYFIVRGSKFDRSITPNMTFEGAGDALFSADRKHLWYGFGFRSSFDYKKKLDELFEDHESIIIRPLALKDPRFYHLDTCFCPLDTGELLWFPEAFDDHSRMIIESWYCDKMISVKEEDAVRFACNAVSVGHKIILPEVSDDLRDDLTMRGYEVIQVNMDQFLRSGGACKCLTLEVIE